MAETEKMDPVQATVTARGPERKPYSAPTLRRLGTVRELTLGTTTGCLTETIKKFPRKKGM
jgi:hypothetical protein